MAGDLKSVPPSFPLTAAELWRELETRASIVPTGCTNLDELLEGGVYSGEVTELCGAPGVGKTQLCYSTILETCKVSTNTVVYMDTCCSFDACRLAAMLNHHSNLQQYSEDILERVHCYVVSNVFEALQLLADIEQRIITQCDLFHCRLRLIVIDSITILISPILGGKQFEGHSIMTQLALTLSKLAQQYSLAILLVNNTVKDSATIDNIKPALGNTWSHVPTTRLMLHYNYDSDGVERIASIVKSSRQACGISTSFYITSAGLANVP
ncbi:DNA repair protein RAD51 homolog 4-like [Dysidea avara]|uniref:DNA repair protein RAD51 homolog 4-like n=1 Tax=Dysidea avara TaxID=196820 RepID=UPI00332BBCB8